jgi:hypothetical protein
MNKGPHAPIEELAVTALNEHGFAFRQRCLEEIRQLTDTKGQGWHLVSEEYPVSAGQYETVIDFVLGSFYKQDFFFVFECKRALPDYISWVFLDTLIRRDEDYRFRTTTVVCRQGGTAKPEAQQETCGINLPFSHGDSCRFVDTGLEVYRQKQPGRQSQSKTILTACDQVLTGVTGLALERISQTRKSPEPDRWFYIPIIVTTARLFLPRFKISDVSLQDGTIDPGKTKTHEVPWVYFDFPTRTSLPLTPIPDDYLGTSPRDLKGRFKVKSVIIVTSTKMAELLQTLKAHLIF